MNGTRHLALGLAVLLCTLAAGGPATAQSKPEGEMRWALYVTVSPSWFDPAEVVGVLTPFWILYAPHDGLVNIWPSAVGPRVENAALMMINPYPWSAPLEEVRLKKK